jgi:hypothetical protein
MVIEVSEDEGLKVCSYERKGEWREGSREWQWLSFMLHLENYSRAQRGRGFGGLPP